MLLCALSLPLVSPCKRRTHSVGRAERAGARGVGAPGLGPGQGPGAGPRPGVAPVRSPRGALAQLQQCERAPATVGQGGGPR